MKFKALRLVAVLLFAVSIGMFAVIDATFPALDAGRALIMTIGNLACIFAAIALWHSRKVGVLIWFIGYAIIMFHVLPVAERSELSDSWFFIFLPAFVTAVCVANWRLLK